MAEPRHTQLAKTLTARVTDLRCRLIQINFGEFASEILVVLPKRPEEIAGFAKWTHAFAETLERWSSLVEVRQTYSEEILADTVRAARALAADVRATIEVRP